MDDLPTRVLEIQAGANGALRVSGELDSHSAPSLESALGDLSKDRDAVIEMDGVVFMDSSGLRVVVAAHQRFEEAGQRFVLKAPSKAVIRLLEIAGLLDTFHIEPD